MKVALAWKFTNDVALAWICIWMIAPCGTLAAATSILMGDKPIPLPRTLPAPSLRVMFRKGAATPEKATETLALVNDAPVLETMLAVEQTCGVAPVYPDGVRQDAVTGAGGPRGGDVDDEELLEVVLPLLLVLLPVLELVAEALDDVVWEVTLPVELAELDVVTLPPSSGSSAPASSPSDGSWASDGSEEPEESNGSDPSAPGLSPPFFFSWLGTAGQEE